MSSATIILAKKTTAERLDAAMELMSQKGRGPNPTDPAEHQAWIMSNAHGAILNMLKQFYVLGPTIKPADYEDFVGYGLMWCSVVHTHHHEEESWYFGYLNKVIQLEQIEKEHALFNQPLMDMENYLVSCLPAGAEWGITRNKVPSDSPNVPFDAAKVNAIIDTLVVSFLPHFCDEISYLDAEKLRAFITDSEWKEIEERGKKEIGGQPPVFHVMGVLHSRNTAFPPAPWLVVNILIPWVFYWPYRRLWRFAPAYSYWA
ncbi:hypothetical protein DL93DRAFT_2100380 [Clavulina sp. PMI_390]|nr:hypothetical protein DL93DRAFT_2100380 [Clavulina sp. PMI_390]